MKEPPPASAVLPDPALLQKGKSGEIDRVYLNPDVRWAAMTRAAAARPAALAPPAIAE